MPLAWTITLALLAAAETPPPGDRLAAPPRSSIASLAARDAPLPGDASLPGVAPASPSLALLAAPDAPHRGEDDPATPSRASLPARVGVIVLRADGFTDRSELERAISLRLPGLTLVAVGEPVPVAEHDALRAFLELTHTDSAVRMSLILADGRAYERSIEIDADAPVRPTAGALANLVAAIEDDTAVPDRKNVPLPPALVREPAPPQPVPKDIPKPAPVVLAPQTVPPGPLAPRWQLGPTLRIAGAFGLTAPPGLRGVGPGLGLDARAPSGLLLALDLQWLTRAVDRYHLQRVRVALGVGYALRRGGFELPVALLVGVEPWWLAGRGQRVPLRAPNAGPPAPLIGLGLRLTPGYSAQIGQAGARLRVGARLELWSSGQASPGLPRPELRLPGATAHLGGVELQLGLEVGLWLPVGRAHRRPTSP